jgi:transcriptional regulator with XRE-family HTH domain
VTAATLTRAARREAGASQDSVAKISGVAASSLSLIEHGHRNPTVATLEAILAATDHRLVTVPTRRSDAADTAVDIKDALARSKRDRALRRFIQLSDNLTAEVGATRVGLTLTEPPLTGDRGWDAAIAALCAFHLNRDGLPLPSWVDDGERVSPSEWHVSSGTYTVPVDLKSVPREFRERRVIIDGASLRSV